MAEPSAKPKAVNPKIDLSHWRTMADIEKFNELAGHPTVPSQREAFSTIVKSWDVDGDPRDPKSYLALTPGQWKQVQKAVQEATKNFLEDAD